MIKYAPQWIERNDRQFKAKTVNFYEDEGDGALLAWAECYGLKFSDLVKLALRQMMEAEQRGPPSPPAQGLTEGQVRRILREELHGLTIAQASPPARPEAEPEELDDELKNQLLEMFK